MSPPSPDGPYHEGELRAQRLAGEADRAAFSAGGVKAALPPVARTFLAEQPLLVVAATDGAGDVWATMLTGAPGFLQPLGETAVDVHARPAEGDPLAAPLGRPAVVGAIAIEPATRRRVRLNGTTRPLTGRGFRLTLDQVVANCPKYLQARSYTFADSAPAPLPPARRLSRLEPAHVAALRQADTFFVATRHPDRGADASHRGGAPGFVEVLDGNRLRWPDYVGNSMFLTFGNLVVDPHAGLLVPDWETGTLLQLTGTATVDWDPAAVAGIPGARRLVEFAVSAVVEQPGASPLRWSAPGYSRFNPPVLSRVEC